MYIYNIYNKKFYIINMYEVESGGVAILIYTP